MIKAIIIDDEQKSIDNLCLLLAKYCVSVNVVGVAQTADEGLNLIRELRPELVFLDIQMPHKSGFDLLKEIHNPTFEVVFVTAFDQYAIQAIRFAAIDYLLKPININELINAVDRAIVNIEKKKQNQRLEALIQSVKTNAPFKIAIPGNKETVFIDPVSVLFCEADNNYTTFVLEDKTRHISSKPIFEYEELLVPYNFIRCHQSYLVNTKFVKSWIKLDGDRLLLEGGFQISVSRNKKERVKQSLIIQ